MADDEVAGPVVRYVLDVDGFRIDEGDSMLAFDEYADPVRAAGYCEGAVVLESPGREPLELEDAVPFLVTHLCFGALGPLADDRPVTVPFFLTGIDVVAAVRDDEVWLDVATGGRFHDEKRATLRALYACGARFAAFHARLWEGYPDRAGEVANLEAARAAAEAVVARV
ncbi:hypothetical protein [Cellulomonas palmilytica]|uniref:hypothetical protein n=1 Tax=Cellulomonas palmilytica TaxID=2608402 RepID=UPI001F2EE268|nr:hypothetical protein [Cellulomonas palmilytica]UJP40516.1 hypothetical protein F1D97_03095 [Cellulomonas palmilytica]